MKDGNYRLRRTALLPFPFPLTGRGGGNGFTFETAGAGDGEIETCPRPSRAEILGVVKPGLTGESKSCHSSLRTVV